MVYADACYTLFKVAVAQYTKDSEPHFFKDNTEIIVAVWDFFSFSLLSSESNDISSN